MEKKTIVILIVTFILALFLSLTITNFFVSVERHNIEYCESLEKDYDEAYFECLEQNGSDQWDIDNKEQTLKISFWFYLISGFIFFVIILIIIFGIAFIIYEDYL